MSEQARETRAIVVLKQPVNNASGNREGVDGYRLRSGVNGASLNRQAIGTGKRARVQNSNCFPKTTAQPTFRYQSSCDGWDRTLSEDAMIAATARVHGLTVATRNERDFALGVAVFNPFKN